MDRKHALTTDSRFHERTRLYADPIGAPDKQTAGIRPGDPLHTECRNGVAYVERAWPGEIVNSCGPASSAANPGETVRVGDANWRVSDRPRIPSAAQTAAPREVRFLYAGAILMMPVGPERRAEIRQMLVDLLDVVEQTPEEDPLVAALEAYDGTVTR